MPIWQMDRSNLLIDDCEQRDWDGSRRFAPSGRAPELQENEKAFPAVPGVSQYKVLQSDRRIRVNC